MAEECMQIIRANTTHTDQIAPLFDAYRIFYKAPSDLEASRQFIQERLERNESVIFLALDDDKAVGFVQLYPLFASVALKSLWLLNDLYVDPSTRKSGVGEALMHEEQEQIGFCFLQKSYIKIIYKRDIVRIMKQNQQSTQRKDKTTNGQYNTILGTLVVHRSV
jgi:ribosomal protein S18 acetylase RimI-like enzyme